MRKLILVLSSLLLAVAGQAHEDGDTEARIKELSEKIAESLIRGGEIVADFDVPVIVDSLDAHSFHIGDRPSLGVFLKKENGDRLVVRGFTPNSPAEEAGLEKGDTLVGIDDQVFQGEDASVHDVVQYLAELESGAVVNVRIERDGKNVEIEVETMPNEFGRSWSGRFFSEDGPQGHAFGWRDGGAHDAMRGFFERLPRIDQLRMRGQIGVDLPVADLNEDLGSYFDADSGVLVLDADEDSELKAGDVIVAIGEDEVSDTDSLFELLHQHDGEVWVKRGRKTIQLTYEEVLEGLRLERDVTISSQRRRPRFEGERYSW